MDEANLREILADHAARYPRLEAQDLYKLVYHAAMGSEHAVPDKEVHGCQQIDTDTKQNSLIEFIDTHIWR